MDMIFDTHAHYDDEAFEEDREELLASMAGAGIGKITNIAADLNSCKTTKELMDRYEFIYGAFGVHPNNVEHLTDADLLWIKELCGHKKCVAVGEIGLDYYYDEPEREVQKIWFGKQLELAKEVSLPVVIHSRDAAKDTIDLMKEHHAEEIGGVIHCYSYSKESAAIFLNMGFYIGIGGVLTFKNGVKLKEVASYVPMDRIVLETDCPYLAPAPNRGKRNSSLYLPYVVEALAEIKGISPEEVRRITWENAHRLYHLV